MTVDVTWYDPSCTILSVTYTDPWTIEQQRAAFEQVAVLLDDTAAPVDLLFIGTNESLPKGAIRSIPEVFESRVYKHPNKGNVVIVARSPHSRAYGELAVRYMHTGTPIVGSVEAAVSYLLSRREDHDQAAS